jgi:Zn-dependent protease
LSQFVLFVLGALALVPAIAIAIPIHEMGHAAAAYLLGDRSVRYFGYFKPDPRRYLEPMGVLAVFLALVGWGRRVPIQSNRINTMRQKILFELGGPAANLLAAIAVGLLLRAMAVAGLFPGYEIGPGFLWLCISAIWFLNLSIFAFQLLPIPGLDGWNIIEAIFMRRNPRFFFDVQMRKREVWAGCVIVLVVFSFLQHVNLLNIVLTPLFEPASLISYGSCGFYAIPPLTGLAPCLL